MLNYNKKFLFEKSCYSNIELAPKLNSVSLSFFYTENSNILLASSALYLMTNKQPDVLFRLLSKKRKGRKELRGCSVKLFKSEALNLFNYLNLIVLFHSTHFKGVYITLSGSMLTFKIENILVFPELNRELDKFYSLKDLVISLQFNSKKGLMDYLNLMNFPIIYE